MHLLKYLMCMTKVMWYTLTQVLPYKLKQILHVCHFKCRKGCSGSGLHDMLFKFWKNPHYVYVNKIQRVPSHFHFGL